MTNELSGDEALFQGQTQPRKAGSGANKDWRRAVVRWGAFASLGLVALYEYAIQFPQDSELQRSLPLANTLDNDDVQDELAGPSFLQELEAARADQQLDYSMEDVREEFQDKYSDKAKSLLCSGCKLAAMRVGEELSARNASGQPNPTALLNVTKQAVLAACDVLPTPLIVVRGDKRGASFVAYEAPPGNKALAGVELRKSQVAGQSAQRLCKLLLTEARLDMLEALIHRKVPHQKRSGPGQATNDNWERWLCARRTRLCKRSEVQDDEEEDEEGEL